MSESEEKLTKELSRANKEVDALKDKLELARLTEVILREHVDVLKELVTLRDEQVESLKRQLENPDLLKVNSEMSNLISVLVNGYDKVAEMFASALLSSGEKREDALTGVGRLIETLSTYGAPLLPLLQRLSQTQKSTESKT